MYEIVYKGDVFELKCQVKEIDHRVCEYPYSLKQKKSNN